jgi:hypothetical protein
MEDLSELMGNICFANSHQFVYKSPHKIEYFSRAMDYYSQGFYIVIYIFINKINNSYILYNLNLTILACNTQVSRKEAGFCYLMIGKLSWQIHRELKTSLGYFRLAESQERSLYCNKALKVGLQYQIHSTRLKAALQIATNLDSNQFSIENFNDIKILLTYNFMAASSHDDETGYENSYKGSFETNSKPSQISFDYSEAKERVMAAIIDAYNALKYCRKLESSEFKSVYRLARSYVQISKIPFLQDCPQLSESSALQIYRSIQLNSQERMYLCALNEISKLFDKKRCAWRI